MADAVIKRGRPKKLITDDVDVEEQAVFMKIANDSIEQRDFKMKDVGISELLPNCIDDVVISLESNMVSIALPPNMGKISFAHWMRGRGGVFNRDAKNWAKGKPVGNYILLRDEKDQYIARIIAAEEFMDFFNAKLVHGKIKDVSYMILRQIMPGESLTSTKVTLHEDDSDQYKDLMATMNIHPMTEDSKPEDPMDIEKMTASISLFDD
jgi:hypothetical protein